MLLHLRTIPCENAIIHSSDANTCPTLVQTLCGENSKRLRPRAEGAAGRVGTALAARERVASASSRHARPKTSMVQPGNTIPAYSPAVVRGSTPHADTRPLRWAGSVDRDRSGGETRLTVQCMRHVQIAGRRASSGMAARLWEHLNMKVPQAAQRSTSIGPLGPT